MKINVGINLNKIKARCLSTQWLTLGVSLVILAVGDGQSCPGKLETETIRNPHNVVNKWKKNKHVHIYYKLKKQ